MKVFVDANVFFAAARSLTGGSAFILELAKQKKIRVITVLHALDEAEKNIQIVRPGEFLKWYLKYKDK